MTSFYYQFQKNIKSLFIIFLVIISTQAYTQTYILKGCIYDADDKKMTLPLTNIVPLCDKNKGTASDDEGKYYLELNSIE